MHYHHSYHAGNFADVFKHVVLCGLLAALNRKDKPWAYLETHAGAGRYDLQGEGAGKTGEWQNGIGRLFPSPLRERSRGEGDPPEPLSALLTCVRAQNPDGKLRWYPGSPLVIQSLARPGDRLVLCEKVPDVIEGLRIALGRDARVIVHHRDGYESAALLPPGEKRGLVLVDPPFERPDEFDAVAEFLKKAVSRFAGGVYAAWYPIKNRHAAERFERRVARNCGKAVLALRFENGAPGEGQMRSCGMLIVNPPFGFAQQIEPALKVLARELAQGPRAACTVQLLAPDAAPGKNVRP